MTQPPRGTADDPVQLLWTGGWDSCFRLIHLMHHSAAVVQPWYIIDEMRSSIGNEVRAMGAIRQALVERDASYAGRILPTRFVSRDQVEPDADVVAQFRRLAAHTRTGTQYGYLARFARQYGLTLELSMHDKDHGLGKVVYPHTEPVETPYGVVRRVKDDAPAYLDILRPYVFPVFGLSKLEMGNEAKESGYAPLLDLTWFCHTPRNGQPCGRCRPCQQVIHGRMHRRMPLTSRVLGQLRYWRREIRDALVGKRA